MLDPKTCYEALRARDARFDGRIFVGVTSTGIYCRPVCPARPPRIDRCRFFPSAAAAQEAGFRPCLRCRPETTADLGAWCGTSNTVARGLALIAEGELDGGEGGIETLAERLGVGGRQLRRLFQEHLGASPVTVAQTRRVLFAKQLVHETALPMGEIALAAGFGSVRRFNETFRALFGRPPSALRHTRKVRGIAHDATSPGALGVVVRVRYRPPYDWTAMLAHLRARAIDGVERVEGVAYARTVRIDGETGTVAIAHLEDQACLAATIRFPNVRALGAIALRVRRAFDVAADVAAIGAHLARDPMLAAIVAERPGLRAPGAWDGFELAVRAVLGQQVSVEAARRLGARLVEMCGAPVGAAGGDPLLTRAFPTAEEVQDADLGALGMPGARRKTIAALADAAARDPRLFHAEATVERTVARLRAIPGIGEWTAQYIALRAAREPDAFPASDVGLLRGAHACRGHGTRPKPAELLALADAWRPWRAYAAQHLWAADAAAGARISRHGDSR